LLPDFATPSNEELNGMPSMGIETYRKVKVVRAGIYAGASVGNVALYQLGPLNLSAIFSPERPTT